MITMDQIKNIRNNTVKGEQKDAAIIRHEDLLRIKESMVVKTEAQLLEEKKKAEMERTFA